MTPNRADLLALVADLRKYSNAGAGAALTRRAAEVLESLLPDYGHRYIRLYHGRLWHIGVWSGQYVTPLCEQSSARHWFEGTSVADTLPKGEALCEKCRKRGGQ